MRTEIQEVLQDKLGSFVAEHLIDQQRPPCGDFTQVGHYAVPVPEEPAEIFTIKQQEEST